MAYIYKITRTDDKSYIGITLDFNKRINEHRRSKRFSHGIKEIEILFEGDYSTCKKRESEYIELYDTFYNGLNKTPNGKGANLKDTFTTLGFKFSEKTRKKMSDAKKGKIPAAAGWNKGKKTPLNVRMKQGLAGEKNSKAKLSEETAIEIIKKYKENIFIEDVGKIQRNGLPMSYEQAFSKKMSKKYSITSQAIKNLITKKSWKHVWEKYKL